VGFLFSLLFPVVPLAALWAIVRYGPVRSRFWRGENPIGFALFVGGISFLAGFVGPIMFTPSANQGPLLGIFITGPVGVVVGLLWGFVRARSRAAERRSLT
jgi:hypothetical protein